MIDAMHGLAFCKLEALGNDFVLLDLRAGGDDPSPERVRRLADRRTGIGFDQLLILHPGHDGHTDCAVHIYNADGSPARQCGNGMRAIALWLHRQTPAQHRYTLATESGPVEARVGDDRSITVSMGLPDFDPAAAGLQAPERLQQLVGQVPECMEAGTVSVGNPHLVMLLASPPSAQMLERVGQDLGLQACFADGVNISCAHVEAPRRVTLRVHERGVGPTRACGSAACATAAWLMQRSRIETPASICQPGGELVIDWPGCDQPLLMTGPARIVFDGTLP